MYKRDAVQDTQAGKFSSLKYLRKPQRITHQIETTQMSDVLKRNTNLNKSKVIVDKSQHNERSYEKGSTATNELATSLEETLNFNEGTDPLQEEQWTQDSVGMKDYFPIVKPSDDPTELPKTGENAVFVNTCENKGPRGDNINAEEEDDDEPEDRYLQSRKLSATFKPSSILLSRSKSLPTSPLSGKSLEGTRPELFKRSKSVHFEQSEKFEVKYYREDESPLFLRNEAGEYGTRSGKLRKSKKHRRRDPLIIKSNLYNDDTSTDNLDDSESDGLEMDKSNKTLSLVNENLILRAQTPTLLKLDVFGTLNRLPVAAKTFSDRMQQTFGNSFRFDNFRFPTTSMQPSESAQQSPQGMPGATSQCRLQGFVCHLRDLRLGEDEQVLIGNVFVRNISYEKRVIVRYTFDSWRTQHDIESIWVSNNSDLRIENESINIDVFQFAIDLGRISTVLHVEICILYQTREGQSWTDHWDNNAGHNYKVSVHATSCD